MTNTKASPESEIDGRYVAFLRGINVGGHHKIKMTDLVRMFEAMGHRDVRTIIASGNILFSSNETNEAKLTESIENALNDKLGYEVRVMLRTQHWLRELVRRDPFAGFDEFEGHRYVTFYPNPIETDLKLPIHMPDEFFSLLAVERGDLFAISSKMPDGRHGDYGKVAAKAFGKISTTRNWNTVVKITQM